MTRRATSELLQRGASLPPAPAPAPAPDPGTDTTTTSSSTRRILKPRPRRPRPRPRSDTTPSTPSTPPAAPQHAPLDPVLKTAALTAHAALSILLFARDTLTSLLSLLRTPLSVLLSVYLIAVLAAYSYRALSAPVLRAVQPLCAIPGVALLDIPFCHQQQQQQQPTRTTQSTDFKGLVDLQASFEEILEKSARGSGLAHDLKRSEFAIADLNVLVRASSLSCRDELSTRLDDFLLAAKSTSKDLSRFGSSVNGVVDSIISIDNYVLRTLSHARGLQLASRARNPLLALALAPFHGGGPLAHAEAAVQATFVAAGNAMDTNIQALIGRARGVLDDLDRLEMQLAVINDVVTREDSDMRAHQDVLRRIWEAFGAHQPASARYAANLRLLEDLTACRARAVDHVRASLVRLEKMQGDLEDLRSRVAGPGLLAGAGAGAGELPLEVHMETIRRGVDRLADSMDRARRVRGGMREALMGAYSETRIVLEE